MCYKGYRHNEETKRKISLATKGRFISAETRKKHSLASMGNKSRTGMPHSEETKIKMRQSAIGKNKGNTFWLGKSHTKESKKKQSLSHMGLTDGPHSIETRIKMSLAAKARVAAGLHHLYKGGLTRENTLIRQSIESRLAREAAFKRDNYTCQGCGASSASCHKRVMLHAHHIKSFAEFPELRFAVDNLITLCENCHKKTDNFGNKSKKISCQIMTSL